MLILRVSVAPGYCYTDRGRHRDRVQLSSVVCRGRTETPADCLWNARLISSRCRSNMTLNTQREKQPLRRRGSTPIAPSHFYRQPSWTRDPQLPGSAKQDPDQLHSQRSHPRLGQSASYHPGDKSLHYLAEWSSDSEDDSLSDSDCVYRVVLLGDHGVGKTSLAGIFAGVTEKDEQPGVETYERKLTVDGEETTLIVMDNWENDKLEGEDSPIQDDCLKVGSAYVIVYSVTDRSSFDSASELRITLRRARQAENLPIILVGNKSDLVRSREVAIEEGRACAVVFDCKFIETSASLQHNVSELFEGVVRQIRLRRDGSEAIQRRRSIYKRKESLTQKARRFLDRLVARNNQRMAAKARSKSCHDLAVL
ncbi:GTP-binding protein REM 1 isoform X2 [Notolabrus celidotus]|uniref:GTP-binding protein REM 1 isoform X2 n=1 Tax=Notolabrus celidotus TaxID=1203425 RepID=UPI0014903901|nr:GTP-binding protein REM 1 isoform X2 [Notolabrus celidotus]